MKLGVRGLIIVLFLALLVFQNEVKLAFNSIVLGELAYLSLDKVLMVLFVKSFSQLKNKGILLIVSDLVVSIVFISIFFIFKYGTTFLEGWPIDVFYAIVEWNIVAILLLIYNYFDE